MRTIAVLAAGASLAFAVTANAQTTPSAPPPAAQPPASAPATPSAAPAITRVNVVDIKELPEATQTKVNEVVAQGNETDLQNLRTSIDGTPQIKSALDAKGVVSAHVIAASMGKDGTLTLVTKKPS